MTVSVPLLLLMSADTRLELTDGDEVQTVMDFETVTSIPIASFVYQPEWDVCQQTKRKLSKTSLLFSFGDVGCHDIRVIEE